MNHNEWIRLFNEGDRIVTALVTEGYQVLKVKGTLSWKIQNRSTERSRRSPKSKIPNCYILTWFPAPVGEWTLLPKDFTAERDCLKKCTERDRLMKIIQSSLSPTPHTLHPTPSLYRGTSRSKEEQQRPWAIAQLLPDATRCTIARFFNRQDACDHLRFLTQRVPAAKFTMFFDPPDC